MIPIWGSFHSVGGKTREEGQTAWGLGREQDFSVPVWLRAFSWVGIRVANPGTEAEPLGGGVLLPRPERAGRESGCGQSLGNELFQGHREQWKTAWGPIKRSRFKGERSESSRSWDGKTPTTVGRMNEQMNPGTNELRNTRPPLPGMSLLQASVLLPGPLTPSPLLVAAPAFLGMSLLSLSLQSRQDIRAWS